MRAWALGLVLLLAACGGKVGTGTTSARAVGVTFVPDTGGLGIAGNGQRIDFSRSPKGVVPVVDRELGTHRDLGVAGCPTGITRQLDWDGLVLTFTREAFVGWRQGSASAGQTCA